MFLLAPFTQAVSGLLLACAVILPAEGKAAAHQLGGQAAGRPGTVPDQIEWWPPGTRRRSSGT